MAVAMRLPMPVTVPLPLFPELARLRSEAAFMQDDAAASALREGEVLNITNRTPDGSLAYAVACGAPGGQREGWLPVEQVVAVDPHEVDPKLKLSLREAWRRSVLVKVKQDWYSRDPATLGLRSGEVLQISSEGNGWAFGWACECPSRRGWFPISQTTRIESSPGVLARIADEKQQFLSAAASKDVIELLQAVPPPPVIDWLANVKVPQVVKESAQREEHEFRERCAFMEAQAAEEAAAAAAAANGAAEDRAAGGGEAVRDAPAGFSSAEVEQDMLPLVVCSKAFAHKDAKRDGGALLQLKVGDLVRVWRETWTPSTKMCFGLLEKRPGVRGWFPRHHVRLVDDPLEEPEVVPARPRDLVDPPFWLLQRGQQRRG